MKMCRAGLHDLDAPGGRVQYPSSKNPTCRACRLASTRARVTRLRARIKARFPELYGGRCACCGITRPVFLSLDHVQDDGWLARQSETGRKQNNLAEYRRAVAQHRPDIYQILCHNCNMAKAIEDNHTCEKGE